MYAKILIHFSVSVLAFYIIFMLSFGFGTKPSAVLVIMAAYIILYFTAALIIFAVNQRKKAKKAEDIAYSDQFSGIGGKKK